MKLSLAFVALAAADSQAPLISLNLDHKMNPRHQDYVKESVKAANHNAALKNTYTRNGVSKHGSPAKHCFAHTDTTKYEGKCAPTQNSFADECEYNTACQEPIASAYDHHDGDISGDIDTVYRLFVRSDRNKNPAKEANQVKTELDIKQRGEWVITYDVQDDAGNDAEQVQFALIIIDTAAPVFFNEPGSDDYKPQPGCKNALYDTSHRIKWSDCDDKKYIKSTAGSTDIDIELCGYEASGYRFLMDSTNAFKSKDVYDNVGTYLTEKNSDMSFYVNNVKGLSSSYYFPKHDGTNGAKLTSPKVYSYKVTSADFADIFGKDNANNVAKITGKVTMKDTIIPTIIKTPITGDWECGYDEHQIRAGLSYADCYDDLTQDKNVIDVKVTCVPNKGQEFTGYYGDGSVHKDNKIIEKCLGTKWIGGTTTTESVYGKDSKAHSRVKAAAKPSVTGTKAYKVKLEYTVQDKFKNPANKQTKYVRVVDSIAPTLYITKTSIRNADDGYSTHMGDYCKKQAASDTKGDNYKNGQFYDKTGAHCVQTHKDSHSTFNHEKDATGSSWSKEQTTTDNVYGDEVTIQHSAGYAKDYTYVQELMKEGIGFGCYDICSSTTTKTAWVDKCENASVDSAAAKEKEFNMLQPGTYYLKYECSDHAGNKAEACRTFINIDKTRPVITVLQAANNADGMYYIEASRDKNYVDAGATCSDMVDGNISQDVEVSGDVVNMAAVGTYKINYNCEDSAGQTALQATRTVVVKDTTCPTCTVPGGTATITVEASFPYTEVASTCTDTLDGAMPNAVVKGTVDVETTGLYVLTYSVTDKNGNGADPAKCRNQHKLLKPKSVWANKGNHFTKTVVVEDTMVPIISLKYRGDNLVGMMAESTTTTVNGWVIGAVASAVSGVALLGYAATRKATVATSVPV